MNERPDGGSAERMRRVLESEVAAREAEKDARREARSRLEQARADARAIEARAVERVRRMHERAQEADARQCEALWVEARERLENLASSMPGDEWLERSAKHVAALLTRIADKDAPAGGNA